MARDEELVSENIESLTTRIIEIDFVIRDINEHLDNGAPGPLHVKQYIGRMGLRGVLVLVAAYMALAAFAFLWDWTEPEETITIFEWALTFLLQIGVPSFVMSVLWLALFSNLQWSSTPTVVEGVQVRGSGYTWLRWLMGLFGTLVTVLFPLASLGEIWTIDSTDRTGYLIGALICLLPAILMWMPMFPGRVTDFFACLARHQHRQGLNLLVKELSSIATSGDLSGDEGDRYAVTITEPLIFARRVRRPSVSRQSKLL